MIRDLESHVTNDVDRSFARNQIHSLYNVLILVATVLVIYGPTVRYDFVTWDDPIHVSANPYVATFNQANLHRLWAAPYQDLYIPVAYTVFAMIGRISPLRTPTLTQEDTLNLLNPHSFLLSVGLFRSRPACS